MLPAFSRLFDLQKTTRQWLRIGMTECFASKFVIIYALYKYISIFQKFLILEIFRNFQELMIFRF